MPMSKLLFMADGKGFKDGGVGGLLIALVRLAWLLAAAISGLCHYDGSRSQEMSATC